MADEDLLADARSKSKVALDSDCWLSIKVAAWALVFATGATAAVAVGLLNKDFITLPTMFWVIGVAAFVSGGGVFLAQELRRLYERATALRGLYDSQKQYEVLLRTARDERDQLAKANVELMHENGVLKAVVGVTALVRAAAAAERENQ